LLHRSRVGVSLLLRECEGSVDDHPERRRQIGDDTLDGRSRFRCHAHQELRFTWGFMDLPTSEEAKCRRSESEQIRARVDLISPSQGLLRGHVWKRSECRAGAGAKTRRTVVE
jgi:hypothetical protein